MSVAPWLKQRLSIFLHSDDAAFVTPSSVSETRAYYVLLWAVLAVLLIPIWMVKYPGMLDFPNHLARCYIIAHYHDNPLWQQRYMLVHDPIPNLAIESIVVPLLRFFSLLVSGKIFLSLTAALYVLGCSATGRSITGRPNWLALPCAFTFYSSIFLYGFVNYIFGVAVFLCAFAYWMRIRNAMTPLRFFLCCLLSMAAFFAHLSAAVLLGVACLTIALLDFMRDRKVVRLAVKVLWTGCPVVLLAGFLHSSGRIGGIVWPTAKEKLLSLFAPISSFNLTADVVTILALIVCAWVMRKDCKVHPSVLIGLVFFVLYMTTPRTLFTSSGAHLRYIIPCYLLLVLSLEPRWRRGQKAALAVALTALLLHTAAIAVDWRAISHRNEQVLAMGDQLPAGARILVFELTPQPGDRTQTKYDRGFIHVIQYWTVSHGADLSTLFAIPGQQPLVYRQPPCDSSAWASCIANYDYAWTYDPPEGLRKDLLRVATPEATWEKVVLWRLKQAAK